MKTVKRFTSIFLALIFLMSSMSILSQAATNTAVKNFRVLFNDENGIVVGWDLENDREAHNVFLEYSENKTNWKRVDPVVDDGPVADSTVLAIRNDGDNELKPNTVYYFRMVDKIKQKTFRSSVISVTTKSALNKFDKDYFYPLESTAIHIITSDFMLEITDPAKKTAWIIYATPSAIKNGVLTFPTKVNGYSVKLISGLVLNKIRNAKQENKIEKIIVSDGIEKLYGNSEIPTKGFKGLKNLKEVTIARNMIRIGDGVFSGCRKLEKVTFKGKLKGGIDDYAFAGCTALKEIKFPEGTEYISDGAFENCKSLKKVTFPSTLKSIGENAFYGCKSIEGKLKLPKNLKLVGDGAFAFCSSLTGFRIADGNKYFSQKGGVLFDKKKTHIYCYLSGKKTKEYKVPSTVKSVSEYAFAGTKYLKKITFSDNMKELPDELFWKSNVKTVVLPKSIKKISTTAFDGCEKLGSLTVKNKKCKMPDAWPFKGKKLTVYGYKNSTAQKFAKTAKLKFVTIK